jgi:hypothetical protein
VSAVEELRSLFWITNVRGSDLEKRPGHVKGRAHVDRAIEGELTHRHDKRRNRELRKGHRELWKFLCEDPLFVTASS